MKPVSLWTASSQLHFRAGKLLTKIDLKKYILKIILAENSLWIAAEYTKGGIIAFRAAYTANEIAEIKSLKQEDDTITIKLENEILSLKVVISLPATTNAVFRYTTIIKPKSDFLIPYWPRDIMPLYKQGTTQNTSGTVYASQVGCRSGLLFFSLEKPETGSVFYFQDLTSLSDYCRETQTSACNLVGGSWPEIGMTLPVTTPDKPLKKGQKYIISDAYVLLTNDIPKDSFQMSQMFLDYLAEIYLLVPKPQTSYFDWPDTLNKSLKGLKDHKGCWQFVNGNDYLNAYVSDYKTPPESMVQLAVLLPLLDYDSWSSESHDTITNKLYANIENFYDEKLKAVVRWLPYKEKDLDWKEEQKKPGVMDSWYLHHPLLNLSRLALNGNAKAKKIVLGSIDYVIKVAHHFNYQWPVMYKMATLEVVKAETAPGEDGEKDVPGSYAHLMIQIWQLTGDKKYFDEAVKAAKKLEGLGFDLFYQANNTAFTAGALLRLYKETNNKLFLNLSYLSIASILKNTQIWECNYGNAEHYQSFFTVFPLKDAPYSAAYEEQEVYAGICNFLNEAKEIDLLPSVRLLLAEYVKYCISRVSYYYPPRLPAEAIAKKDEIKNGEIDTALWIALEDLRDGWERSGQVGQEVYGAGVAFGIVPRQYYKIKEGNFMLFTEYPVIKININKKSLHFISGGDSQLTFRVAILPLENIKLPDIKIISNNKEVNLVKIKGYKKEGKECLISGESHIMIKW